MPGKFDGRSPAERFWPKVDKAGDCWLWMGYIKPNGYATFYPGGGAHVPKVYVHRWAYEATRGTIPDDLEVDHLCNVRHCVNPCHLELVTHQENQARNRARRKHCKHGHPFDEANTYWHRGNRHCRTCRSAPRIRTT